MMATAPTNVSETESRVELPPDDVCFAAEAAGVAVVIGTGTVVAGAVDAIDPVLVLEADAEPLLLAWFRPWNVAHSWSQVHPLLPPSAGAAVAASVVVEAFSVLAIRPRMPVASNANGSDTALALRHALQHARQRKESKRASQATTPWA